ncbi:energy transducer TonB [Scytonema millei]|uniref:Energy transducer TonB n=1 Tax=Scytonema millei VB511283 TaxID=1245923 RepID=A0A9X5I4A9_9CYAN|nr:energy transducer TonB [Scytonema millei]NHC34367.1 energy transducer TonB [Scytonema millei VB511283]
MGSDNIAIQQREKEARSLKTLLACSLVGSIALHVGLLYAGIDKLWQRNFTQPKPIEVVIVDPPKKPEVKKPEPKPEPPKPKPQPRRVQQPRVRQPQRVVRQSPPPKVIKATPKPVPRAVTPPPAPAPSPVATPNPQLRSQLSNLRSDRAEQTKVLTGRGNPQAPSVAPSNTNRTPVAAGPRTVRQPRETGDSGSNTLSCRRCPEPRYPASARRRGVEGTPKVAFFVDRDGNVSNPQLVQSSGDADLDAAALKQVTRWKYNDLKRGRRVVLRVRFVLN